MRKDPFFSVIIPAHNEEEHIRDSIESIISQTFTDFEIIVINDGSTDNTEKIVQEVFEKHLNNNFSMISYKTGSSAACARNRGAQVAEGTFLVFHDADCIADCNLLMNAYNAIDDYDLDGVATRTTNVRPKNWIQNAAAVQRSLRWENTDLWNKKLDINSGINVAIIARETFELLQGFNEDIFYFEDNDLSNRFFLQGFHAMYIADAIQYHNDPASLRESIGQCKSIVKGIKSRIKAGGELKLNELISFSIAPLSIFMLIPALILLFDTFCKTADINGSVDFTILTLIRSAAKLYYFVTL